MPRLSWTQSHPFSIAWSNPTPTDAPLPPTPNSACSSIGDKTLMEEPMSSDNSSPTTLLRSSKSTDIHFIIGRKSGFTNRLYEAAFRAAFPHKFEQDPEKASTAHMDEFSCFVEGPYTNESHGFDSFTSVLFVAGGSGITHPLGHIRKLLVLSAQGLAPTKRIKLAWIIRDIRNLAWVSQWLEELWRLDNERDILEVEIYVTRPTKSDKPHTGYGADKVKWTPGRPEAEILVGSMMTPRKGGPVVGAVAVNGEL